MFYSKNKLLKLLFQSFLLITFSLSVISCGGSSDDDNDNEPTTATISGTAATGIPIDGNIIVTDSLGATTTATIDESTGNYEVDVTGMTPPFIIAAVPTDTTLDTQYSFALQANTTVNVTPLTTLTLFNASGEQDLSMLASNWANEFGSITQQQLDNAQEIINANLSNLFSGAGLDPAAFDVFSSTFNADGEGFDGILDLLDITLDPGTNSFTINIDDIPFSFDPDIDIGGETTTGEFGSVELSGSGATELGFSTFSPQTSSINTITTPATDFTPEITIETISWVMSVGTSAYTLSVITNNLSGTTASFIAAVSENNTITAFGWNAFSGANVSINSTSVAFQNTSMMGGGLGETPTESTLNITGSLETSSLQ